MKISELIVILEEVKEKYGDSDVEKSTDDEMWLCAGYMSCTGQCYSSYVFEEDPDSYADEISEFDLEKDVCFIL